MSKYLMIRYWENSMHFDYILLDELSIILGVLHINNSAFCEIEFHSTIEQMPLNECHIWWTDGIMFRIYTQNYYRKIWFYRNLHLSGQTNDTYAGWTHMCACVSLSENIRLWTRGIECLWRLNSVVLLDAHETSDNGKIFPLKLIPITGKTINIDHSDTCNFILITKKSTLHVFFCAAWGIRWLDPLLIDRLHYFYSKNIKSFEKRKEFKTNRIMKYECHD